MGPTKIHPEGDSSTYAAPSFPTPTTTTSSPPSLSLTAASAQAVIARSARRYISRKTRPRLLANVRLVQSLLYPLPRDAATGKITPFGRRLGNVLKVGFVLWTAVFKAWLLFLLINAIRTSEYEPAVTAGDIDPNFLDYALSSCGRSGLLPTSFCNPPGNPCDTTCGELGLPSSCASARDLTGLEPPSVSSQFEYESRGSDTNNPRYTLLQHYPYYDGLLFTVLTRAHLICVPPLFFSALFAVGEAIQRSRAMKGMQSMSRSDVKRMFAGSLCGFGRPAALLHNHLLAVQISLGLVSASVKFLNRGIDIPKWLAVRPGFSLCLYLQFMCIASVNMDATVQYVYMSVNGFRKFSKASKTESSYISSFKLKKIRWEPLYFRVSGVATLAIQVLCVYIYCFYVHPYCEEVAYLIVFCIQLPPFFFYGLSNSYFWFEDHVGSLGVLDLNKQLVTWQNILTRHTAIMPYLSISTTLANISLRAANKNFNLSRGPAIVYLVCDVSLVIFIFYLEAIRSSVLLERPLSCKSCCCGCSPCRRGCKSANAAGGCAKKNFLLSETFCSRLGVLLLFLGCGVVLLITLHGRDSRLDDADTTGSCDAD